MEEREDLPVRRTEEEWRAQLTDEEYRVLREGRTEAPFSGELNESWDPGLYACKACGNRLFAWDRKYDAGCGWPSFDEAIEDSVIVSNESHPIYGSEVSCARCGSHIGHLFPDGPGETTGQRYCPNSVALQFDPTEALEEYARNHLENDEAAH